MADFSKIKGVQEIFRKIDTEELMNKKNVQDFNKSEKFKNSKIGENRIALYRQLSKVSTVFSTVFWWAIQWARADPQESPYFWIKSIKTKIELGLWLHFSKWEFQSMTGEIKSAVKAANSKFDQSCLYATFLSFAFYLQIKYTKLR